MNTLKKSKSTSKPKGKLKPFARWGCSMFGCLMFDGGFDIDTKALAKELNKRRVTLKVRP